MASFFEMLMVVCFGISWPLSVFKSYKSRTAKGKSLLFLMIIWLGYVFGISGKFITHNVNYVLIFYILNILMVSCDLALFFRNKNLDKQREEQSA